MALTTRERIAQVAEHIAAHSAHGYSQSNRAGDGTTETVTLSDGSKVTIHGGDYDCSELVRVCVDCALSGSYKGPITYMWTGSENTELLAQGFKRYSFGSVSVRRGDVLLRSGHTAIATSASRQAEAYIDEVGGITGPRRGDQTGREIAVNPLSGDWLYVYRHPTQSDSDDTEAFPVNQTVTFGTKVNVRSKPSTSSDKVATYSAGDKCTIDGVVIANGYAWGTYVGGSGKRRYVALGTTELVR